MYVKQLNPFMRVYVFFLLGTDCQTKKVGIIIRSEVWILPLANSLSVEFKTLESKLLSAVSILNAHKRSRQKLTPYHKFTYPYNLLIYLGPPTLVKRIGK